MCHMQEVFSWGCGPPNSQTHGSASTIIPVDVLSEVGGVQQITCSESCMLVLNKSGRVYRLFYNADSQVCGAIYFNSFYT